MNASQTHHPGEHSSPEKPKKKGGVRNTGPSIPMNNEYSKEEFERLAKLYEHTLSDISEGQVVSGKILAVTEKEVVVDIGFKSEGIIPIDEFDSVEQIKIGDPIEVYLETIEDQEGQLILSRKKADFMRVWDKITRASETGDTVEGRCTRRIKGGIVVDLGGVEAFLPGSQIDVKPIRDFDQFINQTLRFKVVKINQLRKNIVVSRRSIVEEELKESRSNILQSLQKGDLREGVVKNITDFGVFIDLGGVDGLLHITDLSWGRVSHPSEILKLDQKVTVKVLDFDENKERISLGLKQLQPHPWEDVETKYPLHTEVAGRIVSITDYGAFVEIEKGVEGLIHISEMSWNQNIKHPNEILKVGDVVKAVVLSIDKNDKKISLGMKQLVADPWETVEVKYPIGSHHKGIIRNLTQFGAFVELEPGIDGLVHISDLSWTKKLRHPSEMLKKGEELEVIVLGINRNERRISLGHKQIEPNPWDSFEENYRPGTDTTGKITRIIDKGVIAELPMGVEGFVATNHLSRPDLKKPVDAFKVGDELNLRVTEFDKENKKITLSVDEYFKGREKAELDAYISAHPIVSSTVGEVVEAKAEEKKPKTPRKMKDEDSKAEEAKE